MSLSVPAYRDDVDSLKVGLDVNIADLREAMDAIVQRSTTKIGFTLFTANLDHLVKMSEDAAFQAAYRRADFVTADGWPVVWLLRKQGGRLERTTGADLVDPICAFAAARGLPVFAVGPGPASQAKALAVLGERYPGLQIAGTDAPQVSLPLADDFVRSLAARIDASGARLCLLSLGAPKQELLADALRRLCPGVGFVCVGASLDFIAGHRRRAPGWAQRGGLEWAWRLLCDPRRLAVRYARCLAFFARLLLQAGAAKDGQWHPLHPR